MNRYLSIAFIAAAALLISCSKEAPEALEAEVTLLRAFQEGDGTKATYNGSTINWDANDALSVFPAGASSSIRFAKESGNANGFYATENVSLNGIYALYPYNAYATLANGKISTEIKTTQTATPGTFATDANLAVAYSDGGDEVYFKNAVSYIKISYRTTVTNVGIKKITFTSLSGTSIAGSVTLVPTISNGRVTDVRTESPIHGGSSSVELSGNILPNTDYYIVVAPVSLTKGYRITFTDNNGNKFSKDYTAAKNKATLVRNNISATGVKNVDNYTINLSAYWRVKSADEFTGGGDKYLLVKETSDSSTGYRVFDESQTDVFVSTGQPLVDKFAGGSITGLSSKLSSWKTGSSAPLFMSHYVLYCFREAYTDDGLQFGPGAAEGILNPTDAYAFTVNTNSNSSLGLETSFNLYYNYSGVQSTPVTFTNCYLDAADNNSFKLIGKITQDSIDGLVDVFFLTKGDQFTAAVTPDDIHSGANRAVNAFTQIGFCSTEIITSDERTIMNNCFMIRNYYLCNYPNPESVWIYKKATRKVSFADFKRLYSNN